MLTASAELSLSIYIHIYRVYVSKFLLTIKTAGGVITWFFCKGQSKKAGRPGSFSTALRSGEEADPSPRAKATTTVLDTTSKLSKNYSIM